MGPVRQNLSQRTARTAHLSVLMTAQLQYTIQHRTVLIISSLTSRQPCCLSEEKGRVHCLTVLKCGRLVNYRSAQPAS